MRLALGILSIVGGLIGAFVLFLVLLFASVDSDRYGTVPLPGSAVLELPAGDVDVFYRERANEARPVPGFELGVSGAAGLGPDVPFGPSAGSTTITVDGRTAQSAGNLDVPRAGPYSVSARGEGRMGRQSEVILGRGIHVGLWTILAPFLLAAGGVALGVALIARRPKVTSV